GERAQTPARERGQGARHRLGRAARRRRRSRSRLHKAALSARGRRPPAGGRRAAAAMTLLPAWLRQRLGGAAPAVSEAQLQDAPLLAALHGVAFQRGWSAEEFERLLVERNVVADRAMDGTELAGFVVSRIAADQAEILSIAV